MQNTGKEGTLEFFSSLAYYKGYDKEAEKVEIIQKKMKPSLPERSMLTLSLQSLHSDGKTEEMFNLIEETWDTYKYTIDYEVAPTRKTVKTILDTLKSLDQKGIVSIGCSNGLLEFMMGDTSTKNDYGIGVTAVDLPKGMGFFSPSLPSKERSPFYYDYMPVTEIKFSETFEVPKDQALLFCFGHPFDNLWERYLKTYKGECIVIIGKKYYTCPYPEIFADYPWQVKDKWELLVKQDVGARSLNAGMAIYKKLAK
jgi:hypothetical protein